jgi:hypothetical protein
MFTGWAVADTVQWVMKNTAIAAAMRAVFRYFCRGIVFVKWFYGSFK